MKNFPDKKSGFTLLEMVIALAVISIVVGITAKALLPFINKAKLTMAKSEIRIVAIAAEPAYAEACIECNISGAVPIVYSKERPAAKCEELVFEQLLQEYIGTDIDWNNVQEIFIDGKQLIIKYDYKGRYYYYIQSVDGAISTSSRKNPDSE